MDDNEEKKSYADLLKEAHPEMAAQDAEELGGLVEGWRALMERMTTPVTDELTDAQKEEEMAKLSPFVAAVLDFTDLLESSVTNLLYKAYYLTPKGSFEEHAAYALFKNTYPKQAEEFLRWLEAQQMRSSLGDMLGGMGEGDTPDLSSILMRPASEGPLN
jgi:hypothetical protein